MGTSLKPNELHDSEAKGESKKSDDKLRAGRRSIFEVVTGLPHLRKHGLALSACTPLCWRRSSRIRSASAKSLLRLASTHWSSHASVSSSWTLSTGSLTQPASI